MNELVFPDGFHVEYDGQPWKKESISLQWERFKKSVEPHVSPRGYVEIEKVESKKNPGTYYWRVRTNYPAQVKRQQVTEEDTPFAIKF